MARGPITRLIRRLSILALTLGLLAGPSHGAAAAPAGQVQAIVDEIRTQVSQIRGLPIKNPTPVVTLPRPALTSRLGRELNTEHAIREFLTSQMLLEVLGAMPRGFDLRQLQLRLLDEQTVAVYDYDERTIYLVAEAAAGGDLGADSRLVVAHEVTHALQDQSFGLKRVLPAEPENSDAATAARALVEGDAMLTMRIWGRQFLRPGEKRALGDDPQAQDPVLDSAPPLVRGELLFPYDAGWVFAQLRYQDGGFESVNQAFLRPPTSTEQILHPEKYAAGETPVQVTIPPLEQNLGGTWVTRRTDVFGELILRLLLEPSLGWATAEQAAEGWGGDAYTILEDASGRRIVGLVTVWDTESDAAEMYNAYVESIEAQYKTDQRRTVDNPAMGRWIVPQYQLQVLKTDNVVRIVYAPDAPTLDRADALLANAGIGPSGPVAPRPATAPLPTSLPTPTVPAGQPTDVNAPTPTPLPTPGETPDVESVPADGVPATPEGQPPGTLRPPAAGPSPIPLEAVPTQEPGPPSEEDEDVP
jgi:hypothetical protein